MLSVTVVISSYNDVEYLNCSVSSTIASVNPELDKIIIINDGSEDDTAEVARSFAKKFQHVSVIDHPKNQGFIKNQNSVLEKIDSDLVAFLSADDLIFKGSVDSARQRLKENPEAGFFCASTALFDEDDKYIGLRPFSPPPTNYSFISSNDLPEMLKHSDNWFIGPSVIFRVESLKKHGLIPENLGSISDAYIYRKIAFEEGFVFDHAMLAGFRLRSGSVSSVTNGKNTKLESLVEQMDTAVEHTSNENFKKYMFKYKRVLRFGSRRAQIIDRNYNVFFYILSMIYYAILYQPFSWRNIAVGVIRSKIYHRRNKAIFYKNLQPDMRRNNSQRKSF